MADGDFTKPIRTLGPRRDESRPVMGLRPRYEEPCCPECEEEARICQG